MKIHDQIVKFSKSDAYLNASMDDPPLDKLRKIVSVYVAMDCKYVRIADVYHFLLETCWKYLSEREWREILLSLFNGGTHSGSGANKDLSFELFIYKLLSALSVTEINFLRERGFDENEKLIDLDEIK